jgi:hypothetical protein
MFGYNDNDPADPWKSYNPNLPSWTVQQLSHMDRISGYWIYTGDNITFYYEGVYSSSVIPLSSGWNLIGYPKNSSTDVSTILGNISFNILKMYDTPNDTWYVYTNDSGNNTLQTFDAYKGYWIYASYDQSLNIVK